jgi:hypothetical protein
MTTRTERTTYTQNAVVPPAPTSDIPLGIGNLMDDKFFLSLDGMGVLFKILPYKNIAIGDTVFLWMNGQVVAASRVMSITVQYMLISVDQTFFMFSGVARVFYTINDVKTNNPNMSGILTLHVVRGSFTNPWAGTYPAPSINPSVYADVQAASNTSVQVTITYSPMLATDSIALYFDLLATTLDKPPGTFYTLPGPPPVKTGSTTGTVVFTLGATEFTGIDENIGYVYYGVTRPAPASDGQQYPQSIRTPFQVDTVAPFN